ncbi:MAG: bifunctional hydroxymethylpyrimidine kinase/phosphomethylpyrimidine kinase [Alphaproteobacteria bacterium]|nr:bifunctional hydroxymethylpyrimidine kinase/phosphomethylpyrimidine kinase [Alphaproteobacteria bacterium]
MSALELRGRVLVVAGSDSGGGAGIQADIKTVTALGGFSATAITAVTDQDTNAVHGVHALPPAFVAAQIGTVLSDIGADVIKTGMLGSIEVIDAVATAIDNLGADIPRVVDPVMVAKGGHRLISEDAVGELKKRLISGATIVTPNLPEAEVLTGLEIKTVSDMDAAIDKLRQLSAKAVLLKGGHLEGDHIVDMLITDSAVQKFEGRRIVSSSTHGTGCTLASAIAVSLAQNQSLATAVERARDYVLTAIETAPGFGSGHGPLNHGHTLNADPYRDRAGS